MNPGPSFTDPLNTPADVAKLKEKVDVDKELGYVFKAITQTRIGLKGEVPLIGFCGAPWTLFAYMIEGGGSKFFIKSKTWLFKYPDESHALLLRIADVCVDFLVGQVKAGAQVLFTYLQKESLPELTRSLPSSSYYKYSTLGRVNSLHTTLPSSLFLPSNTSLKVSAKSSPI